MNVGAEFVDVNDLFLCRDNRYIMIEGGPPYMKLLKGYLNFFDCGYNKKSIAREVANWDSTDSGKSRPGMMGALLRRSIEGGSYHVNI